MTPIARRSKALTRNALLKLQARARTEDNLTWLNRALATPALRTTARKHSRVLLIGGADPLSFRLRLAQAHIRSDLTPSSWSQAFFLPDASTLTKRSATIGISLTPETWYPPYGFAPTSNAIQHGTLANINSPDIYPNVALLAFPVAHKDIATTLGKLENDRISFDLTALLLRWLQYAWGTGVPANPLGDGFGMPSAAMLELAFSSNGFDLTPGLESRSSCPEAIWQSASWWHDYNSRSDTPLKFIYGAYSNQHQLIDPKLLK